ncbi:MAG: TrmH family RNA methyltransferase [Sphingopyxis sp.]
MTAPTPIALAVIEPEIAGNVGAMLRTAACFDMGVHVVEPCGFAFGDAALRRAGMDYAAQVPLRRHADRTAFLDYLRAAGTRLILLSTAGENDLYATRFEHGDVIAVGSEGAGAPRDIFEAAALRVRIAIKPGLRSLNVSVAAAIALAEAKRQLQGSRA